VNPLTCQAAVHAASDQLAGLLSDAERGTLEDHLAGCDSCSCLIDQLRSTVAVLGSRPEVQVPDSLRAMVAHAEGGRAEALTAQLPHLYALANALDANAADDLVQETLTSALADPDTDTTGSGLAAALTRVAAERSIPVATVEPGASAEFGENGARRWRRPRPSSGGRSWRGSWAARTNRSDRRRRTTRRGSDDVLDVRGPAVGLETWVAPSENTSSPAVNARGMSAGATTWPSDTSTSSNPCTT
jgi:hypothetical protein